MKQTLEVHFDPSLISFSLSLSTPKIFDFILVFPINFMFTISIVHVLLMRRFW